MSSKLNLRPIQQEALDWYRKANSKYVLLNDSHIDSKWALKKEVGWE